MTRTNFETLWISQDMLPKTDLEAESVFVAASWIFPVDFWLRFSQAYILDRIQPGLSAQILAHLEENIPFRADDFSRPEDSSIQLLNRELEKFRLGLSSRQEALENLASMLPLSFRLRMTVTASLFDLRKMVEDRRLQQGADFYFLVSWMESLPCGSWLTREEDRSRAARLEEEKQQLIRELEQIRSQYTALHKNYTTLMERYQRMQTEQYLY